MKVPFRLALHQYVLTGLCCLALVWLVSYVSLAQNSFAQTYATTARYVDSLILFEDYKRAIDECNLLSHQYAKSDNWPAVVRFLSYKSRAWIEMEDYQAGYDTLKRADRLAQDHLTTDHPEMAVLWQQCGVFYSGVAQEDLGLYPELQENGKPDSLAGQYFDQAEEVLKECCPDSREFTQLLMDFGEYLVEGPIAKSKYEKALQEVSRFDIPGQTRLGEIYAALAWQERYLGEYQAYRDYLQASVDHLKKMPVVKHSLIQDVQYMLATEMFDDQSFDDARRAYLDLLRREKQIFRPRTFPLISYYAMAGSSMTHLDMYSLSYLDSAFQLLAGLPTPSYYLEGYIYRLFGEEYMRIGDLEGADKSFHRSAVLFAQVAELVDVGLTYLELSKLEKSRKNLNLALQYADSALTYVGFDFNTAFEPDLLQGQDVSYTIRPLLLKSQIYYELFRQSGDEHHLHESLNLSGIIEQISEYVRNGRYSDETNILVSDYFYESAAQALKAIYSLYQLTGDQMYVSEAFDYMEHNRYAQLSQELYRRDFLQGQTIPDSLVSNLNRFRYTIDSLRNANVDNNAAQILQLSNQYDSLRAYISSRHPGYFQIRYDSMYSLQDVQSSLEEGEQLLEYFWFDTTLTILSVTRRDVRLSARNIEDITDELNVLLKWMHVDFVPDSLQIDYQNFAGISHRLFGILVSEYLEDQTEKLIVSADAMLAYLPFEIMLMDTLGLGYQDASYLLRRCEIQYIHNANLMLRAKTTENLVNPQLLAMAYSSEDDTEGMSSRVGFEEIPHSGWEVLSVDEEFMPGHVEILSGDQATESAFKQMISGYQIVHLALHGIGGDTAIYESRLILKSESDSLDGNLFAHELYPLDLQGLKLAVLSACETGVGKVLEGEGVFSIARGFAFAGTPSLVMSLWEADDQSTAYIMKSFYHHLNEGHSVGKSIQKAKLDYLSDPDIKNFRPYFWAAFVPMGDTSLSIEKGNIWIIGLTILIGIAVLILLWLGKRKGSTTEV